MTGVTLQNLCNREGTNTPGPGYLARARIGIIGNNDNEWDCNTPDSALGFGLSDNNGYSTPAPVPASCGNRLVGYDGVWAPYDRATFGYVMVREACTSTCGTSCVDLRTSEASCGACGRTCAAGETCGDGLCCPAGQVNCSGRCVDLTSNDYDCGTCGNQCNSGESCSSGVCGP